MLAHRVKGDDVDLLAFPVPRWHEHDGGRYIGTGCFVVTSDPDSGVVNGGCYRMEVQDGGRGATIAAVPGKHGAQNIERWFAGAVAGERVPVIAGPDTGLPIPAGSELAVEGWLHPDRQRDEGPFGEWTGYYSGKRRPCLAMEITALYHRDDPIILGAPPGRPPHDYSYMRTVMKSAMIEDELVGLGIAGIAGAWAHEAGGGRMFVAVSVRQRYAGHARQVGLLTAQLPTAAYMNRFVVVVDDGIDPSNLDQVIWAMCTRSDPERDIEIQRHTWGSRLDPLLPEGEPPYNSRAVIDACRPYERRSTFPRVAESDPGYLAEVLARWGPVSTPPNG